MPGLAELVGDGDTARASADDDVIVGRFGSRNALSARAAVTGEQLELEAGNHHHCLKLTHPSHSEGGVMVAS